MKLLQIARLTQKKGHIYTLEAFARALETCPNMALTIVGSDFTKMKNFLTQYSKEHGIDRKVTFLDAIDFNMLYAFMKDYQVFIHPSCHTEAHDSEGGAPVVFLDAQATGMPIISTTHCDIPEEVIDGETGILTKEKDVDGIAQAIKFFYEMDFNEYENFSMNARRYMENNYDIRKTAVQIENIYRSLLL